MVQEDTGMIKVFPQFDTSSGGADNDCKPDNTCWFNVIIYNNDDATVNTILPGIDNNTIVSD